MGRARGVDLRAVGSRNVGATNAFRELGPRWGVLVFVLDSLKGLLATLAPRLLAGAWVGAGSSPTALLAAMLVGGVAAILGHVFSPWLRFKGGRGVATSLGAFLGIVPGATLIAFLLWVLLVWVSRRVSVGSIGAALAYPFLVYWRTGGTPRIAVTAVAAAVAALVIVRHVPNIRRLLTGTEPPFIGARKAGRT